MLLRLEPSSQVGLGLPFCGRCSKRSKRIESVIHLAQCVFISCQRKLFLQLLQCATSECVPFWEYFAQAEKLFQTRTITSWLTHFLTTARNHEVQHKEQSVRPRCRCVVWSFAWYITNEAVDGKTSGLKYHSAVLHVMSTTTAQTHQYSGYGPVVTGEAVEHSTAPARSQRAEHAASPLTQFASCNHEVNCCDLKSIGQYQSLDSDSTTSMKKTSR